jgi:hypothetical protein
MGSKSNILGRCMHYTDAGRELLQDAAVVDSLADALEYEFFNESKNSRYTYVGSGHRAYVHELPGYPELCLKTTKASITKASYRYGSRYADPEDLLLQLWFMDTLKHDLVQQQSSVYVPDYYCAVRSRDGSTDCMLMENVSSSFVPVDVMCNQLSSQDESVLRKSIKDRIKPAISSTVLRFAVRDLWPDNILHGHNILIQRDVAPVLGSLLTARLCIIDANSRCRALTRGALLLRSSLRR